MNFQRTIHKRKEQRAGGVNMEYVILATLIAAAVVIAVIVFSRSILSMFIAAGEATTLREQDARQNLEMRRGDRRDDAAVAHEYHDSMHQ